MECRTNPKIPTEMAHLEITRTSLTSADAILPPILAPILPPIPLLVRPTVHPSTYVQTPLVLPRYPAKRSWEGGAHAQPLGTPGHRPKGVMGFDIQHGTAFRAAGVIEHR